MRHPVCSLRHFSSILHSSDTPLQVCDVRDRYGDRVTEMDVGLPIGLFICVRLGTLQPIGISVDIMVYHSELEFCQCCPRVFLGVSKQPQ